MSQPAAFVELDDEPISASFLPMKPVSPPAEPSPMKCPSWVKRVPKKRHNELDVEVEPVWRQKDEGRARACGPAWAKLGPQGVGNVPMGEAWSSGRGHCPQGRGLVLRASALSPRARLSPQGVGNVPMGEA